VVAVSARGEQGFTLIELLLGMALSLIVLVATLTTFSGSVRNAHTNDQRFDDAEVARNALDTQARQLRNLALSVGHRVHRSRRREYPPGEE